MNTLKAEKRKQKDLDGKDLLQEIYLERKLKNLYR